VGIREKIISFYCTRVDRENIVVEAFNTIQPPLRAVGGLRCLVMRPPAYALKTRGDGGNIKTR